LDENYYFNQMPSDQFLIDAFLKASSSDLTNGSTTQKGLDLTIKKLQILYVIPDINQQPNSNYTKYFAY
jgi:hypothetical protein